MIAGIYHLLVALFVKPVGTGYEATFRVVCYSAVTALAVPFQAVIGIVPFIGPIIGALISIVVTVASVFLSIVGIREVHATITGNAALVVLIPVAVLALLSFLLIVVVGIGAALFLNSL